MQHIPLSPLSGYTVAGHGFQYFNQVLKFRKKIVLLALPNWYTFPYQTLLGVHSSNISAAIKE